MQKTISILKNEDGSVIVIALLIMALLTIIGISATNTTSIELQIAGNDRIYKQNFYRAEGAAMAGAQSLENETVSNLKTRTPVWLNMPSDLPDSDNIATSDNWDTTHSDQVIDSDNHYLAVYRGIAPGASMDMTAPTVHGYAVYGRSDKHNGRVIIQTGYKRRY